MNDYIDKAAIVRHGLNYSIEAAVRAERERCAKIAEKWDDHDGPLLARFIAAAIRSGK